MQKEKSMQAPLGGDCNEGVKARPGQDVTMRIKVILITFSLQASLFLMLIVVEVQAKVSQPDGRGKIFFDKPSFEIRFGKPNAKTLVKKEERLQSYHHNITHMVRCLVLNGL